MAGFLLVGWWQEKVCCGELEYSGRGGFKWGNDSVASRGKFVSLVPWHFTHQFGVVNKGDSCVFFGSNQA